MTLDPRVIPTQDTIYGWIEAIFLRGTRRPAYPADQWTEEYCVHLFDTWGLENVRLEPVELPYWEPRRWSLTVRGAAGHETEVPCFPLPHSSAGALEDVEVARFDEHQRDLARGRIAVREIRMMRASRWYRPPWVDPHAGSRVVVAPSMRRLSDRGRERLRAHPPVDHPLPDSVKIGGRIKALREKLH